MSNERGRLLYAYFEGAPVVLDDREAFRWADKQWRQMSHVEAKAHARLIDCRDWMRYFGEYPHLPEVMAKLHLDEARLLARERGDQYDNEVHPKANPDDCYSQEFVEANRQRLADLKG